MTTALELARNLDEVHEYTDAEVDTHLKRLLERYGRFVKKEGAVDKDDHPGLPGKATNSVGAGDSFAATLCMGLLNRKPLPEINHHANRVATYVCSQDGATPVLPADLLV